MISYGRKKESVVEFIKMAYYFSEVEIYYRREDIQYAEKEMEKSACGGVSYLVARTYRRLWNG